MTESRIPCSSGRFSVAVLNGLLKLSISPELAVQGPALHTSRASMDRWGTWIPSVRGVRVERGELAGLYCETHIPAHSHSNQVILYFHGGGFALGSPRSHRNLVSRLASCTGVRAIAMHYRKAPEHPFPAALGDTVKLYQYCLDQGIKPSNILLAGDSAGGNLVLTTLLKLKQDGKPMPAAACAISPWCDLTLQAGSIRGNARNDHILTPELLQQFADLYAAEPQRKQPLVSPVFGDCSGLPPLLIQVGSREILLDDARAMATVARTANVPVQLEVWDGMQHVWHYSAFLLKDGQHALQRVGNFFRENL